ncbi:unnamed protein product [Bursaphelenchus okinawaensis]|uniref:Acyl-CoA thioesterase-like C-terminal domain-containing protein n=1 Tax=Bursaphelenchus okinawaensis TaxID=465554 RepID=A0A811LWX7_9BILA|nr:unnamed protein product [Bursaphelenchus okinawaensis]CAG9128570.1 unnamed protein product [Bursaphelenchus okinawaensis]
MSSAQPTNSQAEKMVIACTVARSWARRETEQNYGIYNVNIVSKSGTRFDLSRAGNAESPTAGGVRRRHDSTEKNARRPQIRLTRRQIGGRSISTSTRATKHFRNQSDNTEKVHQCSDEPANEVCWVKSLTPLGDDEHLHHCVAAFISDVAPVGTPLFANAAAGFRLGMAASLDHSMWIHRLDFRIDNDWVLYETESPVAAASRALIHGKMWTRDGRLVLSTAQEILLREDRANENGSVSESRKSSLVPT